MSITAVKFFHSGMAGAPVISGTPGSMIAVLDACGIDGWGSATVDSVVISGGVVTVTRGAGHPFEPDCVTEISGASVSGGSINGQHKVLSATADAYTFAAPAGVGNQTATGTISHKVAAAGWTKPYSGTNLAAYRMDAVEGLGHYLRVDDTDARNARARGYGSMTGIDAHADPFPQVATVGEGGLFWGKSNMTSSAARDWTLYADSRGFILAVTYFSGLNEAAIYAFGEFPARKSPDPWATYITGSLTSWVLNAPSSMAGNLCNIGTDAEARAFVVRGVSGIGSAVEAARMATVFGQQFGTGIRSGGNWAAHTVFPDPANNSLLLSPMTLLASGSWRGNIPGYWYCPQRVGSLIFGQRQVVTGIDALPGRRLRAIECVGPSFVDVTGPWR